MTKYKNENEMFADVYYADELRRNTYKHLNRVINYYSPIDGLMLLEVGCGTAYLSTITDKDYYGCTMRLSEVSYGERNSIKIFQGDIVHLNDSIKRIGAPSKYDIVVSVQTIEYVSSQDKAIEEMVDVLKKDGYIYIIYDCYPDLTTPVGRDYLNILSEHGVKKLLEINNIKLVHSERLNTEMGRVGTVLFVGKKV